MTAAHIHTGRLGVGVLDIDSFFHTACLRLSDLYGIASQTSKCSAGVLIRSVPLCSPPCVPD